MRSLHVAALPFPTQQGTQAAVHAMLQALYEAGHDAQLLCYAHGVHGSSTPYRVHRVKRSLGVTSLRSGPSLSKLALDALLTRELKALVAQGRPDWVVAHHVEAALACIAAGVPRFLFVAHTSLGDELKVYFPAALAGLCDGAGALLDRALCRRATRASAVSPALARRLGQSSGVEVRSLRLPWPLPPEQDAHERARARTELGYREQDEIVLYAGNLDAYQGLPVLAESIHLLARARPALRLLVATQASASALAPFGFPQDRTRVIPLANEVDRRRAHAAADVVAVPRVVAGGLPIKLLDALARGAHVVAMRRAAAGLSLDAACTLVADDEPQALARALEARLLLDCREPSHAARAYVDRVHTGAAFLADFCAALGHDAALEIAASARSFSEPLTRGDKVL